MNKQEEIAKAKEVLRKHGYYTDNLWCIEDVQTNYVCSDEEAYGILDEALNNEATMEQIWFAINMYAEEEVLPEYIPQIFSINGFFKDDKTKFYDYLVCEYDDTPDGYDDKDIFYYGLSENEIIEAISLKWKTDLDFVIVSYEKVLKK